MKTLAYTIYGYYNLLKQKHKTTILVTWEKSIKKHKKNLAKETFFLLNLTSQKKTI